MLSFSAIAVVAAWFSGEAALLLALFLATFVLEDAATVSAALLASGGMVSTGPALAVLYAGIFLGDLGLYALGFLAGRNKRLRKWIGIGRIRVGRRWLGRRLVPALIGARFVPGLRLPTYTASGFFQVSFVTFALVAAGAAGLWTTGLFCLVYLFGETVLPNVGPWRWVLAALVVFIIIGLPHVIGMRRLGAGLEPKP
ncbi:MAG: hypothetical protein GC199_10525 [Alphaproteobacteria bacterium]|nr:hypothetical protein [Alphaproteobacteria bacterium]